MTGSDSGGRSEASRRRSSLFRERRSFGRRAEIPEISVSHFETGHRFPNAESLRRLADALGVSADYLLDG